MTNSTPMSYTVIVRTTGSRPLQLEEALLSLADQTRDPECILVIFHDHGGNHIAETASIVTWARDILRLNIRLMTTAGGSRGLPLKQAVTQVETTHFCVLDDDDLVLPQWIETFASVENSTTVIRQPVMTRGCLNLHNGARISTTTLELTYGSPFSWVQSYRWNQTPLNGVAFPTKELERFDLTFPETIDYCEDWDLLMRAAILIDVIDVFGRNAIYSQDILRIAQEEVDGESNRYRRVTRNVLREGFLELLTESARKGQLSSTVQAEFSDRVVAQLIGVQDDFSASYARRRGSARALSQLERMLKRFHRRFPRVDLFFFPRTSKLRANLKRWIWREEP